MDKKFKFSEQSTKAKILYLAVIAILTVTAIVIAIASAANKAEKPDTENTPPITDGTGNESGSGESGEEEKKPEYKITKGSGSKWRQESTTNLTFTLNAKTEGIVSISIDGKQLDASH